MMRPHGIKRYWLGCLLLVGAAIGLSQILLIPQYEAYQASREEFEDKKSLPTLLKQLPKYDPANPEKGKTGLRQTFQTAILSPTLKITTISADKPTAIPGYSSQVMRLPTTVTLQGTFNSFQTFLKRFNTMAAFARIRKVSLKISSPSTAAPEESPALDATLDVDVMVRQP